MDGDNASRATHLTAREQEVLQLVGDGFSTKHIAIALGIAPKTVEAYIEHIRLKIGASNRPHMISLAIAKRLLIVRDGNADEPERH